MNLVQIGENTIVDKDKIYALVGAKYDGKEYTNVYRSFEQETMNANRDIMRFIQILDELVVEGDRD